MVLVVRAQSPFQTLAQYVDAARSRPVRYGTSGIGSANHLFGELLKIDGLRIFGTAPEKAAVVSFLIDGAHAHDLATLLDLEGVAVRSGQHCAHPLLQFFGVAATCRASFAFYNTHEEVDALVAAIHKSRRLLG